MGVERDTKRTTALLWRQIQAADVMAHPLGFILPTRGGGGGLRKVESDSLTIAVLLGEIDFPGNFAPGTNQESKPIYFSNTLKHPSKTGHTVYELD